MARAFAGGCGGNPTLRRGRWWTRCEPGQMAIQGAAARNRSRAVIVAWAGGFRINWPGQDRRGNLGALPGVHTAGFHASRFALAYPLPTRSQIRYVELLRFV